MKMFPKCFNSKCTWNMGKTHRKGYDYLDNTCYHNSDSKDFKNCEEYDAGLKMKKDYTYCLNKDETCIHRRGCKRWVGNYSDDEVRKLYTENRFVSEVNESKCIPNYKDKDSENNFEFLDRFRSSDGK